MTPLSSMSHCPEDTATQSVSPLQSLQPIVYFDWGLEDGSASDDRDVGKAFTRGLDIIRGFSMDVEIDRPRGNHQFDSLSNCFNLSSPDVMNPIPSLSLFSH